MASSTVPFPTGKQSEAMCTRSLRARLPRSCTSHTLARPLPPSPVAAQYPHRAGYPNHRDSGADASSCRRNNSSPRPINEFRDRSDLEGIHSFQPVHLLSCQTCGADTFANALGRILRSPGSGDSPPLPAQTARPLPTRSIPHENPSRSKRLRGGSTDRDDREIGRSELRSS